VIVAGIITFAAGVRFLIGAVHSPLQGSARLALCGGVALYLLGHVIFRLRLFGELGREKLVVGVVLLVLYAVGGDLPGWAMAAAIAALLACLCAAETAAARAE
jgi:low temperature requirement protein LtrA